MKPTLPTLRVLAVDDNRTNLHILQVFLKKLGHTVILAENGQEAVEKFESEQPDIVLLDIMMPVMDGFEAARRIKAQSTDRWVPIIFLSALNRDENLVEGLESGGDDYLTKPINFVVLEAKMRSMHRSLALQQQAFDSLNRVQAISDNVMDAIVTIDSHGIIVATNKATERMFHWSQAELLGQNVKVLVPSPHFEQHDQYIQNYVDGGPPKIIGRGREVEAKRMDGSCFPVELGVTEIRLDGQRMFIGVIRDITERKNAEDKLRANAELLQAYYEQTQSEQQLAMRLMEKQLHRDGLRDPRLHYRVLPAQNFSGDIVAAARSPEGRFYTLLADATGHGLAAAISVLPVLAIFYRMTSRNHPVREIILELNQQIRESMPIGRFVAATLVCLDDQTRIGEIWVGGTPSALLFDRWGRMTREFCSDHLPLGIVGNNEADPEPECFTWEKESQIALFSDGLLEAESSDGKQFAMDGLKASVLNQPPEKRFEAIQGALNRHLGTNLASDDVSLMLIDCDPPQA